MNKKFIPRIRLPRFSSSGDLFGELGDRGRAYTKLGFKLQETFKSLPPPSISGHLAAVLQAGVLQFLEALSQQYLSVEVFLKIPPNSPITRKSSSRHSSNRQLRNCHRFKKAL
jgi:hypothetical protein